MLFFEKVLYPFLRFFDWAGKKTDYIWSTGDWSACSSEEFNSDKCFATNITFKLGSDHS